VDSVGLSGELGLLASAVVSGDRVPRIDKDSNLQDLVAPVPPALVFDAVGSARHNRIERAGESPVAGLGLDWPPEATICGGAGCRRVPLALLTAFVAHSHNGEKSAGWPIVGARHGETSETLPHEVAIGSYLARCADRVKERYAKCQRVIAPVANATPLRAMTQVLKASGGRARLIWRPVAALISAIEHNKEQFARLDETDHALVVYMGIDGYEATLLHVISRSGANGPELVVPGRPRLTSQVNVHSGLAGVLAWMADRGVGVLDGDLAQSWARTWACMVGVTDCGVTASDLVIGPWDHIDHVTGGGAWEWFGKTVRAGDCDSESRRAVTSFVDSAASLIASTKSIKVVVLAGSQCDPDSSRVAPVLRRIPRGCDVIHRTWAVPEGAAIFGWREAKRWATYSDYLPQLEICVERAGVPEWKSVVESEWIDAGTPYRNTQGGFKLAKPPFGQSDRIVDLAVTMEGDPHVRKTQDRVVFPLESRGEDVPLTIEIEVQAASGEPRVTAVPDGDISSVVLDWGLAQSTGQTKEAYLDSLPRSFPPIESVRAAPWWHRPTKYRTISVSGRVYAPKEYIEATIMPGLRQGRLVLDALKRVRTHAIRRSWNRDDHVWEALVSSEGKAQLYQPVIDELQDRLFRWLLANVVPRDQDTKLKWRDVIKVLAWTSFSHKAFEQLIVDGLSRQADWIHAVGNGIRTPSIASKAIRHLSAQLENQFGLASPTTPIRNINNPLKQLAWLLALRNGITSGMRSEDMQEVVEQAFKCACQLREQGNVNIMFRWAMRCMVLSLRHRQHDIEFLDPSSDAAKRMLHFCRKLYLAIGPEDEFAKSIVEGGIARPPRTLEQRPQVARDIKTFIEYLNRRGTGSIIIEGDDDDDD
jgi:hypothetical protein